MDFDPTVLFWSVLVFLWVEYLWEVYLGLRQRKIYRENVSVPSELTSILDAETFTKARLYSLDKSTFGGYRGIFSQILTTLIIYYQGFPLIWKKAQETTLKWNAYLDPSSELQISLLFVFYLNVFNYVIDLPWSVYSTFVVEEKHGFNKETPGFFIKDQIKKFFISQLIMLPLIAAIIKVIQHGGDYFFIYLWLTVLVITLFMMIVYPEFIAPLFDKYRPLPEGDLRSKIEELAASIEFPLYKLFVVQGSKRSSHSNAYFYGFFKFKRIVLFDTLLQESEREKLKESFGEDENEQDTRTDEEKAKGCSTPEILAVLGHELGHWKLNHVLKNIIISEVNIFAIFALFNVLYQNQTLYTAFGFPDSRPILIGLVVILQFITAPYNAVLSFAMTCLSRKFEFQADEFASKLGKAAELRTSLIKLNNDNLGFPIYDSWYSAWHHSHPPLLERINALKKPKSS